MSTGGPDGIKGTGLTPQSIATDASKDVKPEGKTASGVKITQEIVPKTSIRTGAAAKDLTETKKPLAEFDVGVERLDGENEQNVFFGAVGDTTQVENLPDDLTEPKTAAIREAGKLYEDALSTRELETSEAILTSHAKILDKMTTLKEKVIAAWASFVSNFRPSADTANVMGKGVGQLVDLSSGGDEAKAKEAVDEIAGQLESNPGAVLKSMEKKGLHQVVSYIMGSIKVANNKNLGAIKQTLIDHSANFPALKGMSLKARDIMINGTLIVARIGNAGGKGRDVVQLESRGYIVGKMPAAKLLLVESVLSMDPEQAMARLEEWHAGTEKMKGTNFKKALNKALGDAKKAREKALRDASGEEALEYVGSSLFDGNELEVDPKPQAPSYGLGTRRPDLANRFAQKAASIGNENSKVLKRNMRLRRQERAQEDIGTLFGSNELEVATEPKAPAVDEQATRRSKVQRDKAREKGITPEEQEKLDHELMELEWAKKKLVDGGGLIETISKEMQSLEDSMAKQMQENGASKEEARHLAKGIMVGFKLAAWTDDDSSDAVTHLGPMLLGKEYQVQLGYANKAAAKDIPTVKEQLLNTWAVTSSDFKEVLERLEARGGDDSTSGNMRNKL